MMQFGKQMALWCLAFSLLAGCATERRVLPERSVPRPAWTDRPMDTIDGRRMFVGMALAENILDERHARERAIENAAENVLRTIAMDIEHEYKATERRQGALYKAGGKTDAQIYDQIQARIGGVVENLKPVEFYSEKWFVRENTFGGGFWRYKYFVLAEYGEQQYKALLETTRSEIQETE